MADFGSPIATGVFPHPPDIANAKGTDLSFIGNLPDAYWAGLNQQYQQRNRDLFKNGVPTNPNDLATALLQAGGAPAAPLAVDLQNLDVMRGIASRPTPSFSNGGNTGYTSSPQGPPSSANAVRSSPTVMGDVEGVRSGLYDAPAAPGQRPPIQQEASATQPVAQRFGAMQPPSAPPSGAMAGATPVQTTQVAPPTAPDIQAQQLEATAARAEQVANYYRQQATAVAAAGPKYKAVADQLGAQADFYQKQSNDIREKLVGRSEPTPGQRDYSVARSQGYTGTFQQFQNDQKAGESEAAAGAKALAGLADKGIEAKGKLAQLNAVQQLGENVGYGAVPKLQSFLGRYGVDTKGLSDIQAYERAIDSMAPQLRPVGSGRLLQNELNAFKSALGGLMTTPEGRRISIENLKLINNYSEQVGAIAADTSLQPSQRYAKIYAMEPPTLRLEVTKTGLAPTGSPGAAQAAPQFQEGQTATNPRTGAKAVFTNGKWMQGL